MISARGKVVVDVATGRSVDTVIVDVVYYERPGNMQR